MKQFHKEKYHKKSKKNYNFQKKEKKVLLW